MEPRAAIARDPPKEASCPAPFARWRSRPCSRPAPAPIARVPSRSARPRRRAAPPRSRHASGSPAASPSPSATSSSAPGSSGISIARPCAKASCTSSATWPRRRPGPSSRASRERANPPWRSRPAGLRRSSSTFPSRSTGPRGPATPGSSSPPPRTSGRHRWPSPRRASASCSAPAHPRTSRCWRWFRWKPISTGSGPGSRARPPGGHPHRHPAST